MSDDVIAEEKEHRSSRSSFKGTGFLRLWTGESVSLAGAEVSFMAIGIAAATTLAATPWQMGVLEAAESAAVLLLGLSSGVWADRYERRRIMQLANVGRCLLVLSIPLFYWFDALTMPLLYAVVFGVGALTLLFDSAMSAYLPRLVPRHQLGRANSWMEASTSVGNVAGPGLAGLLIQIMSAPLALIVDAVSYLVSTITLAGLPKAEPGGPDSAAGADAADTSDGRPHERTDPDGEKEPHRESHRKAVMAGLSLLLRDRIQRPMVLAAAHFNIFHAMFYSVHTLYVLRVLDFSPALLGATSMAGGLAGLIGATSATTVSRVLGQGRALVLVYAAPGLSAVLVPLAHAFDHRGLAIVLVSLSTFTWTFAVIINLVISETVKQTLVPDHMLGRVTASTRFISWGVQPVGALLGGLIGSWIGLGQVMLLSAAGLFTSALWPLLSPVRRLVEPPPAADTDDRRQPTDR